MNTLKNVINKAFSASVVFVTVFSMLGLGALVPTAALADDHVEYTDPADVEAGDYVEYQGAVFFVNANMEIVYFPRDREYFSWNPDDPNFANVLHLDPAIRILDYFDEPSNGRNPGVGYRSSCNLVKRTIDPTVYAVLPGNELMAVTGEYLTEHYGAGWASMLRDVDLAFWSNYTVLSGTLEGGDDAHEGFVFRAEGSDDTYVVMDGVGVMVDGEDPCVHEVSQDVADRIELTTDTVTFESLRSNPAQHDVDGEEEEEEEEEEEPMGELTFSLHPDTPETALIPEDATHVPYLTFNVTAGDEDALLEEITFERFQLGDDGNFDKLWLAVDGVAVTNDQKVQSDDTLEISLNYGIGAGDTVTFVLMANLDQSTGTNPNGTEQDAFRITDVEANGADVDGFEDVEGNYMVYSAYTLGTAAISVRGSNQEVEAGESEEILGEFEIDWNSDNESGGYFKSVRFEMQGTADLSDLKDLDLQEDNGSSITSNVTMWGDYVTFIIDEDEQMFDDSETRRFEIVGEISGADDGETVLFELEDARDLHFVEEDIFVGAALDLTGLATNNRLRTYTIDAGQFTVSQNGTRTPSNEEYAKDAEDVIAFAADVDLGQCVSVDGLKVFLHSDSTFNDNSQGANDAAVIDADIERAELWIIDEDGDEDRVTSLTSVTRDTNVGAAADSTITTDEFYYDFDQTFKVRDNDILEVRLDLDDDATTNTYKLTFSNSGANTDFDSPEYCGEGGGSTDDVEDADLTGTVTGNEINITAASVTVTRDDGFASGETFIAGADHQTFFSFVIDAGNASDITVQTLNFDMAVAGDATYVTDNYQKFTGFYLLVEGEETPLAGETDDMDSSGSLEFQNLELGIEDGENVTVSLVGNIDTGAEATTSLTFTLDASDSVVDDAQDEQIDTFTTDTTSANLTISTGASLTVEVSGDTPNATIAAVGSAGQSSVPVDLATFSFTADDGQVNLTDLYVANNTNTTGNAAEDGADSQIREYQVIVDGQVVKEKNPTNGVAHFELEGGKEIAIEDNETVEVTIRGIFAEVDSAADSGKRVKVALYAVKAETEGPGTDLTQSDVTGVSTSATTGLAALDSAPTGEEIAIYRSVPTLAGFALDSDSLNNGTQDIYKFSVAADDLGSISWGAVNFEITGACGVGSDNPVASSGCFVADGFSLYEKTETGRDEITLAGMTVTTTPGTNNAELRVVLSTSSPNEIEKISAGSSKTYILEGTLQNVADGDNVKVQIKDFSSAHFSGQTFFNALTDAAFTGPLVWSDDSETPRSQTEAQWYTGRDVFGLDTLNFELEKNSN